MSSYELDNAALEFHARHILLDEIGTVGQECLAQAQVVLVGLGGLGCPAAQYLAACGIGKLILVDDDQIETSNLQRQLLYRASDVGAAKATTAATTLAAINPHITIQAHPVRATADTLDEFLANTDVVIDASDNFVTRHLLNRACHASRINLVAGAAEQFDGQVMVFAFAHRPSPCYACLYPPAATMPDPTPCATLGVFAPMTGMVGTIMAAEVVRLVALPGSQGLQAKMLAYDMLGQRVRELHINPATDCPVCANTN